MGEWLTRTERGTVVTVWLVPGSSRDTVDGVHGDALKLRVSAPAERGRANAAAADLLSERLGAVVRMVGGRTSRTKRFEVDGLDPAAVRSALVGGEARRGD